MTSESPRIYLYKITFEEVPYYYYGVHKEKRFNEEYWGSPVTNKWCWELYTPKKQILELFEFSDDGWLEALEVEKRLIRPFYNTDGWCLNESCGGKLSLDSIRRGGRIVGRMSKENKIGLFTFTEEQRIEIARKGGSKSKELKVGICGLTKEQRIENGEKYGHIGGKKGGKRLYELGLGVHARTRDQMSEHGKIGGKISGNRSKELSLGFFALSKEQKIEIAKRGGKVSGNRKWKCLETGFITNAGNLTKYQRARGIDTSKRVRVGDN